MRELDAGRDLQDVADAVRREQAASRALAGRSWYRAPGPWLEWRWARLNRWVAQNTIRTAEWDDLARADIDEGLRRFHADRQDPRNWFHPRTLDRLDEILPIVMEHRGMARSIDDVVDGLPPLRARLNATAIEAYIMGEVDRRRAVTADPVLLTEDRPSTEAERRANHPGERWLTVQHQASGLRAVFKYTPGDPMGHVFSKPYRIDSIDPARPEDPANRVSGWRDWVGLGIGERIYLKGAEMLPDQRWGATSVSPAAAALRVKLHARDPWRWWSRRCSCRSSWEHLTAQSIDKVEHSPVSD